MAIDSRDMSSYFVKMPGQGTCVFELPPEDNTVHGLISAMNTRGFDQEDSMKLFWGGKELRTNQETFNRTPLPILGINPGSTLEVSVPMRGGAQCGKMVKGRSKEKPQNDELAAKLKWLQDQAAGRIAASDALKAQRAKAENESAMMKKNNMKIMTQMRSLMRNEKLGELKKSLEVLSSLHEAAVKRKDDLISRLIANHEFAFEQHTVR
jgi:hypothetical protein